MKKDINFLPNKINTKVIKVKKSKEKNINDNKQLSKIIEVPAKNSKWL
jgi:hypothetical protein